MATSTAALLAVRVIEGAGFFGVVLAAPSLLSRLSAPADREVIMALWSAYMPIGIAAMLLLGPALPAIGWQHLWLANAAVACALAVGLRYTVSAELDAATVALPPMRGVVAVLPDRRCILMPSAFFVYFFRSLSFSPLLLITALGNPLGNAALLGAAGMIVSAIGNIVSGPLLRIGMPTWVAIALTFATYMVSMIGIFCVGFSTPTVALLAALALGVGGLAPGAIYASAPKVAPTTDTLPVTVGLYQQASNLGQFAGPLAIGFVIERAGWEKVPLATVPLGMLGLGLALAIRNQLPDRPSHLLSVA
jgi:MFS transporter, DHA1 family, inner membrane transport protein